MKVVSTPGKGRHLLAVATISAGEVLAVDRGLLCVLTPARSSTNCAQCLASTVSPLHCPTCSAVVFCSVQCRGEALATHHQAECRLGLTDLSRLQSCSALLLILRFFTQKSQQFFRDNREDFTRAMEDNREDFTRAMEGGPGDSEAPYVSSDYIRLLGLVCHRKEALLEQVWQFTLALFLLQCLAHSGWLDHKLDQQSDLTEEDVYLAMLAVHMRGVTSYNTHQVGERLSGTESLLQTRELGLAVRPTVALLNHSCWPNTVRCSAGREVVIMATRTINTGQEVTDIYTECFYEADLVTRQKKCGEYQFQCRCEACQADWPLLSSLPSSLQDTPPHHLMANIPRHLLASLGQEIKLLQDQANLHWNEGNITLSRGQMISLDV